MFGSNAPGSFSASIGTAPTGSSRPEARLPVTEASRGPVKARSPRIVAAGTIVLSTYLVDESAFELSGWVRPTDRLAGANNAPSERQADCAVGFQCKLMINTQIL